MASKTLQVNLSSPASMSVEVTTTPYEYGRSRAFSLKEARIVVAGIPTDLMSANPATVIPLIDEVAYPFDGASAVSVTGASQFSSGAGPEGEDVQTITLQSSVTFEVGDYVRNASFPGGVYEVVAVPDGTTVQVKSFEDDFDIDDGDSIIQVTPTGIYRGRFELDISGYMSRDKSIAEVTIVIETVNTGNGPKFDRQEPLAWVFTLNLDVAGLGYSAG